MTQMLASVANAAEAEIALDGGADIIDLSDSRGDGLGKAEIEAVVAAVAGTGKTCAFSAALGHLPHDGGSLAVHARALSATGVQTLCLDAGALGPLHVALSGLAREIRLVGALFVDRDPDFGLLERMAAFGFHGALLDTAGTDGRRLLDHLPPYEIESFCRRCRELGLAAWLAGALQSPDVPRLLLLEPDVLGFRRALRLGGRREGALDPRRVALIRDLIPRDPSPAQGSKGANLDRRTRSRAGARCLPAREGTGPLFRAGSGPSEGVDGVPLDRIFVRDFLTTAEIGAYAHERGARQRLLFNIDAAVARAAVHADDMRAVVSYDVILDAVRIVVGRGHIDFIETVAEEVAAIVLKHPRVREVRVRVEKLDVVTGSVGVEIVRA